MQSLLCHQMNAKGSHGAGQFIHPYPVSLIQFLPLPGVFRRFAAVTAAQYMREKGSRRILTVQGMGIACSPGRQNRQTDSLPSIIPGLPLPAPWPA